MTKCLAMVAVPKSVMATLNATMVVMRVAVKPVVLAMKSNVTMVASAYEMISGAMVVSIVMIVAMKTAVTVVRFLSLWLCWLAFVNPSFEFLLTNSFSRSKFTFFASSCPT